jgi:DegV family protein with EDD domain
VFLVDTLEYLRRGGRIGNAQAFFGTLLNVKPLLEIRHGQVEPLERVRSRAAGLKRLLEITSEALGRAPAQFAVLHAEAPEEAVALEKELRARCNCAQVYTTEIGPAIGRHSGPDAVGIAFYRE